jgi:hydrogenase maturation protein HypF
MRQKLACDELAPGLDKLGIMLPYAPLLAGMASAFGKPLVATSGNVSGAPICFTNATALTDLAGIADFFLMHNRDIIVPQDDSVLSFTDSCQTPILLRRSRGWAPAFPHYATQTAQTMLATGALLKSGFAIGHLQQVYLSQYLGNTDSYEARQAYRHTLHHLLDMLQAAPSAIITDKHPLYFSHELAVELSAQYRVPLHLVQHHKAHLAAILGEHGLQTSNQKILGVIWDGTGLGDDGNSWGGEFFLYEQGKISRPYSFEYFPYLLGDKMAMEPRLSALALLHEHEQAFDLVKPFFSAEEWKLYRALLNQYQGIYTSSVGRLMDAAASLVLGISRQSYEGEAAMRLEAVARQWCLEKGYDFPQSYYDPAHALERIPAGAILHAMVADIKKGLEIGQVAAKFHYTLVVIIENLASTLGVKHIAFSGGVFQNSLLADMVQAQCGERYNLYFHRHLSPNDENISFGQLVYVDGGMK